MSIPPRVTVIIPTFNRARFVTEAIRSVLDQTFSDLELIVVDDGSTDDTQAVIAAIRDPRLRVLRQKNGGISAAMNAGLQAAQGEYIARLDSDDVWLPGLLDRATEILDKYPDVGVVYARAQAMSEDGAPCTHHLGIPLHYPNDPLLSLAWGDPICNVTALARRSCFDTAGPYDETLRTHEDWDMWLRVARHFRFYFLDRTLARFREHGGRITSPESHIAVAQIESRVRVLDKLYDSAELPERLRRFRPIAYRNVYIEIGFALLRTGYRARGLAMLHRAVVRGRNPLVTSLRILWFATAVRTLERFGRGRRFLQFQSRVRRRWRTRLIDRRPARR